MTRSRGVRRHRRTRTRDLPSEVRELTGDERDPCLRFRPGALQALRTTQRTDGIRLLGVVDQTMEPTNASLWLRRSTE